MNAIRYKRTAKGGSKSQICNRSSGQPQRSDSHLSGGCNLTRVFKNAQQASGSFVALVRHISQTRSSCRHQSRSTSTIETSNEGKQNHEKHAGRDRYHYAPPRKPAKVIRAYEGSLRQRCLLARQAYTGSAPVPDCLTIASRCKYGSASDVSIYRIKNTTSPSAVPSTPPNTTSLRV